MAKRIAQFSSAPVVTRDIRDLQMQEGNPVAFASLSNQTASNIADSANQAQKFNDAVLGLLKTYQSLGTKPFQEAAIAGQEEQIRRLQATPQEFIGASPGLQASVRGAAAGAVSPSIQGAQAAGQTFSEQLRGFGDAVSNVRNLVREFELQEQQRREEAKKSLLLQLELGGSSILEMLVKENPNSLKLLGIDPKSAEVIIPILKSKELAAEQKQQFELRKEMKPDLRLIEDTSGQYVVGIDSFTGEPISKTRIADSKPLSAIFDLITTQSPITGEPEYKLFDKRTGSFFTPGLGDLTEPSVESEVVPSTPGTRAVRHNNPLAIAANPTKSALFKSAEISFSRGDQFPGNPKMFTYKFNTSEEGIRAGIILWNKNGNRPIGDVLKEWSGPQAAVRAGINPAKTWNQLTSVERNRLFTEQQKIEGFTPARFGQPVLPKPPAKESADVGEALSSYGSTLAIINDIEKYSKAINIFEGPFARIAGQAHAIGAKLGKDTNAELLISKKGTLSLLIRALGEKGTLAEGDVQRALALIPTIHDTKSVATKKIADLKQLIADVAKAKGAKI